MKWLVVLVAVAWFAEAVPPSIDWQYSPPWQPLVVPCQGPDCLQLRESRRVYQQPPHGNLQPGVPTRLNPNGKSTIIKMAIETIRSPSNASVQLVYIPKGRLTSLANNGLARMVTSESRNPHQPTVVLPNPEFAAKQKRRALAVSNIIRPNAFPMTLVASRGNENTAREQLQLLEAALSSPRATESKNGQLPRVFIAPSNIPPPPGYVKIPLVPQKQAEEARNDLPGTFLTHNNPRPLPPGFVRLSLPPSVSHLSKDIPLVRPSAFSDNASNDLDRDSSLTRNNPLSIDNNLHNRPPPPLFDQRQAQQSQSGQAFINDKREVSPQTFLQNQPQRHSKEIKSSTFTNLGFELPKSIRQKENHNQFHKEISHEQQHFSNDHRTPQTSERRVPPNDFFDDQRQKEQLANNHFSPTLHQVRQPVPGRLPTNSFRASDSARPSEHSQRFETVVHTPPPRIPNNNQHQQKNVHQQKISNEQKNVNDHQNFREQQSFQDKNVFQGNLDAGRAPNSFEHNQESHLEQNNVHRPKDFPQQPSNNVPHSFTHQAIGSHSLRNGDKLHQDQTHFRGSVEIKSNSNDQEFKPLPSPIDHQQIKQFDGNTESRDHFVSTSSRPFSHEQNGHFQPQHTTTASTPPQNDREILPESGIRVVSKGEPKLIERQRSTPRPAQVNVGASEHEKIRSSQFSTFSPINVFPGNDVIPAIGTPATISFASKNRQQENKSEFERPQNTRFRQPENTERRQNSEFNSNQGSKNNNNIVQTTERQREVVNQFPSPLPPFQQSDDQIFSLPTKNTRFRGQVGIQVGGIRHSQENSRRQPHFSNEQVPNHFANSDRPFETTSSRSPGNHPKITTIFPPRAHSTTLKPFNIHQESFNHHFAPAPRVTTFETPNAFVSSTFPSPVIVQRDEFLTQPESELPSHFRPSTTHNVVSEIQSTSARTFSSDRPEFSTASPIRTSSSFTRTSSREPANFDTTLDPFQSNHQIPFSNEATVGPFRVQPFFNSFGVPKEFTENHPTEDQSIFSEPQLEDNTLLRPPGSFEIPTRFRAASEQNFQDQFNQGESRPTTFSPISFSPHSHISSQEFANANNIRGRPQQASKERQINEKIVPTPHRIPSPQENSVIDSTSEQRHQNNLHREKQRTQHVRVTTFKPKFSFSTTTEAEITTQESIPESIIETTTLFPPFSVARRRQRLNKKDDRKDGETSDLSKKTHPFIFGRRIRPRARNSGKVDQAASGSTSKLSNSFRSSTASPNSVKSRLSISSRFRNRGRSRTTTTTEATFTDEIAEVEIEGNTDIPEPREIVESITEKTLLRGSASFQSQQKRPGRVRPAGQRRRTGSRRVPQWLRDRRRRLRNQVTTEKPIDTGSIDDSPLNFIDDNSFVGAESARVSISQPAENTFVEKRTQSSEVTALKNNDPSSVVQQENIPEEIVASTSETTLQDIFESDSLVTVEPTESVDEVQVEIVEDLPTNEFPHNEASASRFSSHPTVKVGSRVVPPQTREYVSNARYPSSYRQYDDLTILKTTVQHDRLPSHFSPYYRRTSLENVDEEDFSNNRNIDNAETTTLPPVLQTDMDDFNFDKSMVVPDRYKTKSSDATNSDMNSWGRVNEQFDDLRTSTVPTSNIPSDDIRVSYSTSSSVDNINENTNVAVDSHSVPTLDSNNNYGFVSARLTQSREPSFDYMLKTDDVFSPSEPEDNVGSNYDDLEGSDSPHSDYHFGESLTHMVYAVAPPEIAKIHRKNFEADYESAPVVAAGEPTDEDTLSTDIFRTVADGFRRAAQTKQVVEGEIDGEGSGKSLVVTSIPMEDTEYVTDAELPTEQLSLTIPSEATNVLGHSTVLEIRSSEPKVCFSDGRCVLASTLKHSQP